MPTLLAVNNYHYRRDGSEVVYFEHNRLLRNAGWEVVPFSMQHPENLPSTWSSYFVQELEFGRDYSLGEKIARVPKVIYSVEARRKLTQLLRRVQPDLCHCHSIYHHLSPSILPVLKKHAIPTVMTLHDLKLSCPAYHMFTDGKVCEACKGGRLYSVLSRRCIKDSAILSAVIFAEALFHELLGSYRNNVNKLIVPCRFYLEKLVDWGWERERFAHVPNFVEPAEFRADFRPGPYFLYFGRLSPEKGLATLIRAAAQAQVPLRLAGHGPQRSELEVLAARSEAQVEFLGHLDGAALHDQIRGSRATALASEWYENAPMSILESYALGKPVIGAAIGGIPELIREQVTGATVPCGSVQSLADALRAFADAPEERLSEMGRNGRHLVEEEYSATAYREAMMSVYQSL